jgi:hypothetical protein
VVDPLPGGTAGSYMGMIERQSEINTNLGGCITSVTTATGAVTGKLLLGAVTYPFTGFLSETLSTTPRATISVPRTGLAPLTLVLTHDPVTHTATGTLSIGTSSSTGFSAWRHTWTKTSATANHGGYHTFALLPPAAATAPQGYGFGSYSVAGDGKLTVAARMPDNSVITTAGFMGSEGQVLIYGLTTSKIGSALGTLTQSTDPTHNISGSVSLYKPASAERAYTAGISAELTAEGSKYVAPAKTAIVMGLAPVTDNAALSFMNAGIDSAALSPSFPTFTLKKGSTVTYPLSNDAKTSITVTPNSGIFSGGFTLVDADPYVPSFTILRSVKYYGIITTTSRGTEGYGCFMLTQLADPAASPPTTTDSSPVLSGSVLLQATPAP